MQTDQKEEKKKRMYEKPRLRTIELAAEEVLAVGCKLDIIGGTTAPTGSYCTEIPCVNAGS